MDYRILGSFEVRVDGRRAALGGEKPQALLAILLLHRNEVVSADQLIDGLWDESPPASALPTLRAYVSRLRKALNGAAESAAGARDCGAGSSDGVLLTRGRGYLLRVTSGELDFERFQELAEHGRDALASGDAGEAASLLREALGVWRGPPLAEFAYEPFAQAAIAQLEELRLAAIEDRVEADLALGQSRELVGELRELVARHPLRERLRGQLMLALYRSGRQAEALESYQAFRRRLSEELGLEPGPAVQQLEHAILGRDRVLDAQVVPARAGEGELTPTGPVVSHHRRRLVMALTGAVLAAIAIAAAAIVLTRGPSRSGDVIPGNSVGAVSPKGDRAAPVVPLNASPSNMAAGDGALWVVNDNAGTVSRIDPAAHDAVQTIQVGANPSGLAVGTRAIWVTNSSSGTVSRIDPEVNRVVQSVQVGNGPSGVAVAGGAVWVANHSDGTLSRIDAITGAVASPIPLGGDPTAVTSGAGALWVSEDAGRRVLRVDPHRGQVTASINVGAGPTAIASAFGSVWVANSLDGTVSRIDPQTDAVTATIPVGDGAGAIAVGAGALWITSEYAGTVSAIDPSADVLKRTITVGNRPQAEAFFTGRVWIGTGPALASHRGGTLTVLTAGHADSFDPVLTQDLYSILPLAYDGLTAYQRVGGSGSVQLVPDLAVSLPSPTDGGTTYTFRLRSGIRYSNGETLRPDDFRRALERELILGGNTNFGGPFADVIGGRACAAHPSRCDLSRGVVVDDAANTVTFHLLAPNPEFLDRLTLPDAYAVPAGTPNHDIGLHPMPATGAYEWVDVAPDRGRLVRNPYFHEWSHAARPDGYPDQIVFRGFSSDEASLTAVERGRADYEFDGVPHDRLTEAQTQFAGQLHVTPTSGTMALILNTRMPPFTDIRVRRALNYAVDRAKLAALLGQDSQPACQILPIGLPGYRRYCPYTTSPDATGIWHGPDLAHAERLIAASGTRGTPITIWNLWDEGLAPADHYIASLLDQLGYPTRVKDFSGGDPTGDPRFADSRTGVQAALYTIPIGLPYPSAFQVLQPEFACQSFVPHSPVNPNWSEFCDHQLDAQIDGGLNAEASNAPDTAALWAQADRTATNQAPAVPLTTNTDIHLIARRVGNYQYSFAQGVLLDQLWVR
jgi:peptide/nickel transport system substrate-binding protein